MESGDIGSRRADCRSAVVVFCDVMLLFVVTSTYYEDRDDRDRSSYNGGFEDSLCYPLPRLG